MVTAHPSGQSGVTPYDPSRRQQGTRLCRASAPGLSASPALRAEELWGPCAEPQGLMWSPLLFCACGGDPQVSPLALYRKYHLVAWLSGYRSPAHAGSPQPGIGFRGIPQVIPADG